MNEFNSQRFVFAGVVFALVVALHAVLPTVMGFAFAFLLVCVSVVVLLRVPDTSSEEETMLAAIEHTDSESNLRLLEAELHAQMDQCHTDLARLDAKLASPSGANG